MGAEMRIILYSLLGLGFEMMGISVEDELFWILLMIVAGIDFLGNNILDAQRKEKL